MIVNRRFPAKLSGSNRVRFLWWCQSRNCKHLEDMQIDNDNRGTHHSCIGSTLTLPFMHKDLPLKDNKSVFLSTASGLKPCPFFVVMSNMKLVYSTTWESAILATVAIIDHQLESIRISSYNLLPLKHRKLAFFRTASGYKPCPFFMVMSKLRSTMLKGHAN